MLYNCVDNNINNLHNFINYFYTFLHKIKCGKKKSKINF